MLVTVNRYLERLMPVITPTSVVIGVLLAGTMDNYAFLIPWIFAFMTFSGSLNSNFSSLKNTLQHPFPMFLIFFVLHILMPLWAWGIGNMTFNGDSLTIIGIILAMSIPTGISSFIWVSIYRGNIPLTLSIILIDAFLAPFIVPLTLSILVGASVEMDSLTIMKGLIGMIVVPTLIGMILNHTTKGKVAKVLSPKLAPFTKLGMATIVMINGAVVAPYLKNIDKKLVMITIIVFCIAFTGYLFAFIIGKMCRVDKETVITITFTGGMRNISTGAVLAVSYFPPPVAVPVVIGMLFQQVLASLYGAVLDRYYHRQVYNSREQAM